MPTSLTRIVIVARLLVQQISASEMGLESRYPIDMIQLPYQQDFACYRVCKWCGVYEPFQDTTEECCKALYDLQCDFDQGNDDSGDDGPPNLSRERRVDSKLNHEAVTYVEMLIRHREEGISMSSKDQCAHWGILPVAHALATPPLQLDKWDHDGSSDTPQERRQHPTSHDIRPPPPSTPPPPSPPPPPEYYKWHVCTGEDDFGNKIWVEYPKHVAEILEYMYNHPLMHEEQTYMYEWTNIFSKKQTVLSVRCQVV